MGMYDTVRVYSPCCGHPLEFQSKAGQCILSVFNLSDAPIEVINDVSGDEEVCVCGQLFTLEPEVTVRLKLEKV